jgi:pimeloyl-ACP methyl ester carboxylesterase
MQERWVDVKGTRLFAAVAGEGQTIVMLHGPMADHRAALPIVAPLSARYRVLTPDLRGSGRSWYGGPLSFDLLADDLAAMLERVGIHQVVVGGVSGGSGVAVRFALRHPSRTRGLVIVQPVFAGEGRGYSEQQKTTFAMMDSVASRALDEGVQVLRPLFMHLPDGVREQAVAMIAEFDAASVVTTSAFLASGQQPFASVADLHALVMPTLLIRGNDALHPAAVSDLYASNIPCCTVVGPDQVDVAAAIDEFITSRARVVSQQQGM